LYAASGDVARAKAAKRSKKYWMANAELILEKQRLKYLNDPEKCRANARDWRNRNIDAAREKNREWAKENRDRMRVSAKEWRARNVDHVREKSREAYARNKEAYKARARNRKARKKNAEGHHTSADIERIRLAQRNKCAICKEVLVKATTHVDHILPLSKGGSNWPKNLQLLCKSCNLKKWSCDPIEFMQEAGFLL
jgi:5-methylcytosine-specific restriction endonuclease McrA